MILRLGRNKENPIPCRGEQASCLFLHRLEACAPAFLEIGGKLFGGRGFQGLEARATGNWWWCPTLHSPHFLAMLSVSVAKHFVFLDSSVPGGSLRITKFLLLLVRGINLLAMGFPGHKSHETSRHAAETVIRYNLIPKKHRN